MTARREFTKQTKRDALARSGLLCEAVGAMYGLPEGQRCNAPLGYGVEFDHVVMDANSKDNSLENCAAVCIKCHKWKTAKIMFSFQRWPVHHEPLRNDAKNLLPEIDAVLGLDQPPKGDAT